MGRDVDGVRVRRGDGDALGELIERYQNRLYRYLLRIVREPSAAEDLFQQTWLRVVEKISLYDPRRSFEAWLFRLARNLALDHLRRARRFRRALSTPGSAPSGSTRGAGPYEHVRQGERAGRVQDALVALPAAQREILSLRFEEEMKLEEIALLLGLPLSTAKSRLRRGLESLRRRLAESHSGDRT